MQGIDVLRDDDDAAFMLALQLGQGEMRGIWLDAAAQLAPHIVEFEDLMRIALEALRRRHLAIVDLGPDAILVAEGGNAGLRGDAGAGEDDDAVVAGHAEPTPDCDCQDLGDADRNCNRRATAFIRLPPLQFTCALERRNLGFQLVDAGLELGASTTSTLTSLFERFENVAQQVEDELAPAHIAFVRRQLHPLLLCSPFLYRCYSKPLGYSGDYEMVNMILRDPLEGGSLFAKLVNLWFLSQPPAEAHRNRVQYLSGKLLEETARVTREGRTARVFNVGCGPAGEVQSFLRQEICDRTDFSLLDFNEETLQHGRSVLESIKQRNGRKTRLSFVKKSVHQMLKEAGKSVERSADRLYDLVYCAGLLDYLADPVSKRLLSILYEYVAPGGLLITTNVDNSNPRRLTMEYVMDWNLIYRNGAGLESLRPDQVPRESARMISDLTGINLYYEMRKPKRVQADRK